MIDRSSHFRGVPVPWNAKQIPRESAANEKHHYPLVTLSLKGSHVYCGTGPDQRDVSTRSVMRIIHLTKPGSVNVGHSPGEIG